MIRFKYYTGILLWLIPVAFCWPEDDLPNIWGTLRADVCRFTEAQSSSQLKDYIDNFDQYWNFTAELNAMADVWKEWGWVIEDGDCAPDGYMGHFSKTVYADMKCLVRDLGLVGPIFKEDLRRFYGFYVNRNFQQCQAYKVFSHAWHLHPVIKRLKCYSDDTPIFALFHYVHENGLVWKTNWDVGMQQVQFVQNRIGCSSVYSKNVTPGLRGEIYKVCGYMTNSRVCHLVSGIEVADEIEKLLQYANSSSPVTEHYLNAVQLLIFASVRKMDKLYPDWTQKIPINGQFQSVYLSTSWADSVLKGLIDYIFMNIDYAHRTQTDKRLQLHYTMNLLPTAYNCPISSQVGSLCWTIGMFDGMVKAVKQSVNVLGKNRKVQVNTAIDHKEFLIHTQTERLLKLSETSQSNLVTIATELRDDIVHSLNHSIQQAAADSTNAISGAVQSGFETLRKHFQQEASFDKEIAKADIIFINGEIAKYEEESTGQVKIVISYINEVFKAAFSAAAGDLIENIIKLTAHIWNAFNPISWLTGGSKSMVDIMDAAADVSQSLATLVKTGMLTRVLTDVSNKASEVAKRLGENQAFLENTRKLVNSLSADTPSADFEEQKNKFIQDYNDYKPAVDKKDLTEVNALWGLVIDEVCDLLDSTSGTIAGVARAGSGNNCVYGKGEVEQLVALNEEIYDFQFEMMDALADCVRASNSYQSASAITTGMINIKNVVYNDRNSDVIPALKLIATYSSISYRVTVLTAKENYCNVLEYREGSRPEVCKTHDWNLANLLSRTPSRYHSTQDFKSVPTQPSSTGDKAYIDLNDLYAGRTVRFQVPNSDWLVKRGWLSTNDRHKPIFVQRFEVYLPVSSSFEKQVTVTAEATVGNQIRRDETEYFINPRSPLSYSYKEGQDSCRNEKIPNPYSSSCRSMPDLCQVSTDIPEAAMQESIYPSIYAMWNIKLSGYESDNLTAPLTDIDLRIGLQTASPSVLSRKKRSQKGKLETLNRSRRSYGSQQCCSGNQFVNKTGACEHCPPKSKAMFNALLCECAGCKNGGRALPIGGSCFCQCDDEHTGEFCETRICNIRKEFTCNNTKCIPLSNYCDKSYDCDDKSDEPDGCQRRTDPDAESGFSCSNFWGDDDCQKERFGQCVSHEWVCDGLWDCHTKKDEATCAEGGVNSDNITCPENFLWYAGACWHFVSFADGETKNGTEAEAYCQEAGGTLAVFTKETEHWFAYTMFIHILTGNTVSPSDYSSLMSYHGVTSTNLDNGLSMFESGIWWIGQFEPDLAHLVHGYQDEEADGSNPNAGYGSDPFRNNGFSDGFHQNTDFGTDAYGSNRYPGRFDQTSDHGNDPFANNDFQDGFYPNTDFGPNRHEHNHFPDWFDQNTDVGPDPSENNFQDRFDPNTGLGSHDNNDPPDWFNHNSQFGPDSSENNNFQSGFDPNAGLGSHDNNDPTDWFNHNSQFGPDPFGNNNFQGGFDPNAGLGSHDNNDPPDWFNHNSQFGPDPFGNNNFQGGFDPNAGLGSHDNNDPPDWFNHNSQFGPDPFGNNNFQRGFDPNAGFGSHDNNDQNGNNNEVDPNYGLGNDTHGNNDQDAFTDSLSTEGSNSSADSETDGQNETGTSQIPAKKCLAIGKADWRYSQQDCGARAQGLICTHVPQVVTTAAPSTTEGPKYVPLSGVLPNETIVAIKGGFQNINNKMSDGFHNTNNRMSAIEVGLQNALSKGFKGLNDTLRLLIEELSKQDDDSP